MSDETQQEYSEGSAQVVGFDGTREDLKSVAMLQKAILLCILVNLGSMVGNYFVPEEYNLPVLGLFGVATLASTVFVFLLAAKLYGAASGIMMGLMTFVPCMGLIVLLIVNGKATSVLQANGLKVGLLGADPSKV